MANFFNPNTRADITSLTYTPGQRLLVGLWGGGPGGEDLDVITDPHTTGPYRIPDPAVRQLRADRSNWSFVYEINTAMMGGPIVRALFQGGDYSAPLKLVASGGGAAVPTGKEETRRNIVDLARLFVRMGCHYTDGTAGNTPGQANGNAGGGKLAAAGMRKSSLNANATDKTDALGINQAEQTQFEGYSSCGGRYSKYAISPTQKDLDTYLAERAADRTAGKPERTWPGILGQDLYPRRVFYRDKPSAGGAVVYGESCHGVPHFDCVGLVNYCYARFFNGSTPFGISIKAYTDPKSGFVKVSSDSAPMDADVVIRTKPHEHIAMIYNAGGGIFKLVQAEDTDIGLTDTGIYDKTAWDRYRMSSQFLRG